MTQISTWWKWSTNLSSYPIDNNFSSSCIGKSQPKNHLHVGNYKLVQDVIVLVNTSTMTSLACWQLWTPNPLCIHISTDASPPLHCTSSNHISPEPSPNDATHTALGEPSCLQITWALVNVKECLQMVPQMFETMTFTCLLSLSWPPSNCIWTVSVTFPIELTSWLKF